MNFPSSVASFLLPRRLNPASEGAKLFSQRSFPARFSVILAHYFPFPGKDAFVWTTGRLHPLATSGKLYFEKAAFHAAGRRLSKKPQ